MAYPARKFWTSILTILAIAGLLSGTITPLTAASTAQAATSQQGTTPDYVEGPFTAQTTAPTVFRGDLRDLPQITSGEGGELPAPGKIPQTIPDNAISNIPWVDPVAQQSFAQGQMPTPIRNFEGLTKADGGPYTPPDTNGDVGPDHYIQTVNIGLGIYDKDTGNELVNISYNEFFLGPVGTPCDDQHSGDVVVLYDEQVDRWIVTDFSLPAGGPYYECIAVSLSGDPVSGGWEFYGLQANSPPFQDAFNDYPKLGVWADGWYMSANMFTSTFQGVRVWALDREDALAGDPIDVVLFNCTNLNFCGSLLPANVRGNLPPVGSPEYFAAIMAPNTVNLWEFHTDFVTPANSTFTGPVPLPVANFQLGASVPQQGTTQQLDSLGDRMMFQLQYRNINDTESLYANHSVASSGVDGIRWYEIRDPGGTPFVYQQSTYQPDNHFRWMGSIAADQEGNIAVGYSISSSSMFPAIRYAGRLEGETLNLLTQNEALLFQGPGSQTGLDRWGDYSDLTIDPSDGCTFWYTQEYATTGSNWRTRIGSFKFPSCGELKGFIGGYVYDAVSNEPLAGVQVISQGTQYNFSTETNASGFYTIPLIAGSYDITAGPFLPGYPESVTANLTVTPPDTTLHDFYLSPVPNLVHEFTQLSDPSGNNNSFPEPGEQDLQLLEALLNNGATTAEQVTAKLSSSTTGVTISTADTTYPDIPINTPKLNDSPYVFSIDPTVACGTDLDFQATITDSISTYTTAFKLDVGVPLPRADFYTNNVEGGAVGWTPGGSPNTWAITSSQFNSPSHSWTDSVVGNYSDNTNNWVRTPTFDLTNVKQVKLTGWFKYALEAGYDYVYIEYSLNGGTTWNPTPLAIFNGTQSTWQELTLDVPMFDNQPSVALRYRLESDGGVVMDGFYVDDVSLSYIPFECTYQPLLNAPSLVSPANGSWVSSPVAFEWQPSETGASPEGYVFYLDGTPVITFTEPITTTTLDVTPWVHTWFVTATSGAGTSDPSPTWAFNVFGSFFLPLTLK